MISTNIYRTIEQNAVADEKKCKMRGGYFRDMSLAVGAVKDFLQVNLLSVRGWITIERWAGYSFVHLLLYLAILLSSDNYFVYFPHWLQVCLTEWSLVTSVVKTASNLRFEFSLFIINLTILTFYILVQSNLHNYFMDCYFCILGNSSLSSLRYNLLSFLLVFSFYIL